MILRIKINAKKDTTNRPPNMAGLKNLIGMVIIS